MRKAHAIHAGSFSAAKTVLALSLFAALLLFTGCFGEGDSGQPSTIALYTVSGAAVNPVPGAPLAGIACVLSPDASAGTASVVPLPNATMTAVTDALGAYSFAGVPAGKYRLASSGENLVKTTAFFTVSADTKVAIGLLSLADWPKFAGAGAPYDPSETYITVHSDAYPPLSTGSEDAGVTVELREGLSSGGAAVAAYKDKGHAKSDGTVDWAAEKTYDGGMTIFRGAPAGSALAITAVKEGYNFESATIASAAPGEITHVLLQGAPAVAGFPVTIVNNSGIYKTEEICFYLRANDVLVGFNFAGCGSRRCRGRCGSDGNFSGRSRRQTLDSVQCFFHLSFKPPHHSV